MTEDVGDGAGLAVAIIGMSCRVPGAEEVEGFWEGLCAGREAIRPLTDAELTAAGVPPHLRNDPSYVRSGAVIEGEDLFDAGYFGYSPREAALLDPQHRVFLECAVRSLQRAGHDPGRGPGRIGVFAASSTNHYAINNLWPNAALRAAVGDFGINLANDEDYLATRTAYKLDLCGPAITVQTACSSSLVAVHLAVQALLAGDCDIALAGGATVRVPQRVGHLAGEAGIGSGDGHCRSFDADASGTVTGNGVAIVVLRRLPEALADGDGIHAVIRGSAVNNDGSAKVGYTAPSVGGQSRVIRDAMAVAGVPARSIGYVEAHGTATRLGDPIEVKALTEAFGGSTERAWCALASVKSNIGHLDAAAGAIGLIKAALALEHDLIPPTLHVRTPNPELGLVGGPFYVNTVLRPWQLDGPRRASVSSFGIGGTNAHVVLEQPPPVPPVTPAGRWNVVPVSARTPEALRRTAHDLATFLEGGPPTPVADAAYTLQVGRPALEYRAAVVGAGPADTAVRLAAVADEPAGRAAHRHLAWVFPGQGSQWPGMAAGLYAEEPVFREILDRGAGLLEDLLGRDLRTLLHPRIRAEDDRRLDRTEVAQPALFLVEYALAELLERSGVPCEAMLGHSVGEYVAACRAGVFSFEDALILVAVRGRLMQSLPAGAMLTVSMAADELAGLLPADVDLAAVNAPEVCTVSGPVEAITLLADELAARGSQTRRLRTSHAFHSAVIDPVVDEFRAVVAGVAPKPPSRPVISSTTGGWLTPEQANDPGYWASQARRPVLFSAGVKTLATAGLDAVLEVGPGRALAALTRLTAPDMAAVSTLPEHSPDDDQRQVCTALARLWTAGIDIDWRSLHAGERRRRVVLPTYPFERRRYWIDPPPDDAGLHVELGWTHRQAVHRLPADRPVLLYDDEEACGPLHETLRAGGGPVTCVRVDDAPDHAALLRSLSATGARAVTIVFGWTCSGRNPGALETLGSLADTLRAGAGMAVDLLVIAEGAWCPESGDRPSSHAPLVRALCAAALTGGVTARVVDPGGVEPVRRAALLAAECRNGPAEAGVAYRGRHRWARVERPAPSAVAGPETSERVWAVLGEPADALPLADALVALGQSAVVAADRNGSEAITVPPDTAPAQVAATARRRLGRLDGVLWLPGPTGPLVADIGRQRDELGAAMRAVSDAAAGAGAGRCVALVTGASDPVAEAVRAELVGALADELASGGAPSWTLVRRPASVHPSAWLFSLASGADHLLAREASAVLADDEPPAEPDATDDTGRGADRLDPVRRRLGEIWRLLLGVDDLGPHDDFYDLGGHSLLATRITARVRDTFGVDVPMSELFAVPTIDAMAERLATSTTAPTGGEGPDGVVVHDDDRPIALAPLDSAEVAPLAPVQQAMWFLQRLAPDSPAYLLNNEVRLTGHLETDALWTALDVVVARHETLRTTHPLRDRRPCQLRHPHRPRVLPVVDLSGLAPDAAVRAADRIRDRCTRTTFDLTRDMPLRTVLVRRSAHEHVLLLTMHHIAGDYWSIAVLLAEVFEVYAARVAGRRPVLTELPVQYAAYAAWQRRRLDEGRLDGQLEYWTRRLTPPPEPPALPVDHARPDRVAFRGAGHSVRLPDALMARATALGREERATPFMIYLAALMAVLKSVTGQPDVCVGSYAANRPLPELESLVGLFANTVALRADLAGDPSYRDLLDQVRRTCTEAYDNLDVPYDQVVKALGLPRELGRTPLFQVLLVVETASVSAFAAPGLDVDVEAVDNRTAKDDLLFVIYPEGEQWWLRLEYNTDLFRPDTAAGLAERFLGVLNRAVARPGARISELAG
jgi:acyl transferase domain-containing protein/acyl carrier protein